MAQPFFTIGHGTRTIEDFIALLKPAGVSVVVDVRTVPRSRTNPQFNADRLPASLEADQIGYRHLAALGGLRAKQRAVSPETNAFWDNQSFHNYADYAMSATFHDALTQLRELGGDRRCAVMCAETVWWRCHRRIIADHLIAAGEQVFHILGPAKIEAARLTPAARVGSGSTVTYPAAAQ
jgi:uncharacterized protein (DUF488 family)